MPGRAPLPLRLHAAGRRGLLVRSERGFAIVEPPVHGLNRPGPGRVADRIDRTWEGHVIAVPAFAVLSGIVALSLTQSPAPTAALAVSIALIALAAIGWAVATAVGHRLAARRRDGRVAVDALLHRNWSVAILHSPDPQEAAALLAMIQVRARSTSLRFGLPRPTTILADLDAVTTQSAMEHIEVQRRCLSRPTGGAPRVVLVRPSTTPHRPRPLRCAIVTGTILVGLVALVDLSVLLAAAAERGDAATDPLERFHAPVWWLALLVMLAARLGADHRQHVRGPAAPNRGHLPDVRPQPEPRRQPDAGTAAIQLPSLEMPAPPAPSTRAPTTPAPNQAPAPNRTPATSAPNRTPATPAPTSPVSGFATPERLLPHTSTPTLGIVTALPEEFAAVHALLDDPVEVRISDDTRSTYLLGHLPSARPDLPHAVVVTLTPAAGNSMAAATATNLARSFPGINDVVVCGVACGVPRPEDPVHHVRLGDIVVASWGVKPYDHTDQLPDGPVLRREALLTEPSRRLLQADRQLASNEYLGHRPWEAFLDRTRLDLAAFARPDDERDLLYDASGRLIAHPDRTLSGHRPGRPRVHRGWIGSANRAMRDARTRDALAEMHQIFAIEMESEGACHAGEAMGLGWFVIRGISDYGDRNTTYEWRTYAALAAAGYARALLAKVPPLTPRGGHTLDTVSRAVSGSFPGPEAGPGSWDGDWDREWRQTLSEAPLTEPGVSRPGAR